MDLLKIARALGAASALASTCQLQAQPEVEPRAPNWVPNDLLAWSPATDPDAP